ncbi:hypothetical protein Tco_1022697 [Tanacetum coccineum]
MMLLDNQGSSPKSVLDNKAFEDSINDSDFNVDMYLNDEEDNGDNVVVPQTPTVDTNMSCDVENENGKEESKDYLKE